MNNTLKLFLYHPDKINQNPIPGLAEDAVAKKWIGLVVNSVPPSLGAMRMHSETEDWSGITPLNLENRMFCKWHGVILWIVALFVTHLLYDNLFKTMTAIFFTDEKYYIRNLPSTCLCTCVHAYILCNTQKYFILFLY